MAPKSRRRKKATDNGAVQQQSTSTDETQAAIIPRKSGTCERCKVRKIKCSYLGDSVKCTSCVAARMGDCAPAPIAQRQPRKSSRELTAPHVPVQQTHQEPSTGQSRKRYQPPKPSSHPPPPQQRKVHDQDDSMDDLYLPTIAEEGLSFHVDDWYPNDKKIQSFTRFLAVDGDGNTQDHSTSTSADNDSESDPDDEEVCSSDSVPPPSVQATKEKKKGGHKVGKAKKSRSKPTKTKVPAPESSDDDLDLSDPETCDFTIPSAVVYNGSNLPFKISSKTRHEDLITQVAERLHRFPGSMQLRYRLDTDKPKTAATSLRTPDEFNIFINRMRLLLVPQRLPGSQKISSRALKPVTAYFEDGADDSTTSQADASSRKSSKKAKSSADPEQPTESGNQHKVLVMELQKRLRCETHSKDKDVYCWKMDGICRVLSLSDIGFWAMEVSEGKATVDAKPVNLYLHEVRSRSRAPSVLPPEPAGPFQPGFPGAGGQPYVMPPFMPMYYPAPPQLGINYPMPTQPGTTYAPPFQVAPTALAANIEYPDVISWTRWLDQHERRNKDGVIFAPFGVQLKEKGFFHISQLTLDYFRLQDLQDWLEIPVGVAVLIMQYAREDIDNIAAGRMSFPRTF